LLAIGGGHGFSTTLREVRDGIDNSLKRMKALQVLGDGYTARFGPGLKVGEIIRGLDVLGKQTDE
jgi:hypothetical protein